ncbi:MAG: flagellar biosynthesis protein FliQ [Deltaproteobacteria bacterium]|nr:flagellar biosynthesis protein FliQ [Thermodesulfobacteriota bacterium]MDP2799789.1 flagellar biosynthesis protein FliQ [Deltaproteobacteria bacterium]MDP3029492.1 flagellar biosynthesis protein FliQ [Deltaproteobacteria bacterium]
MTPEFAIGIAKDAIEVTLLISLPILGIGMVVGLAVSIFQAVTQIQEMTLSFVPKIVAVMLALLAFFPWIMNKLTVFTENLIINIPQYIR